MTTKDQVISLHREHPTWTALELAERLGTSAAYVRATAQRYGLDLLPARRTGGVDWPRAFERAAVMTPHEQRLAEALNENRQLRAMNKKLRAALAPFACLGRNELTAGDFNRARRAIAALTKGESR